MPLFRPKLTKEQVDKKISEAKALLNPIKGDEKLNFFTLLQDRIDDFEKELKKQLSGNERDCIVDQYYKFAKTLYQCISHPKLTVNLTSFYHNGFYYPVGVLDIIKPNPLVHKLTVSAAAVGTTLFFCSIPAFVFNPLAGFIILALAITFLLPSSFALLLPDSPDTTQVKQTEKAIFQEGARLINPEVTFEQTNDAHSESASPQYSN